MGPIKKARVRTDNVLIYDVPSRAHLQADGIACDVWFSREENQAMRTEAKETLERFVSKRLRKSDCIRGLENYPSRVERKHVCMDALCAVLVEQERQWEEEENGASKRDAVLIRAVYNSYTAPLAKEAQKQGLEDYLTAYPNNADVKNIHSEDDRSRRSSHRGNIFQRFFSKAIKRRRQ